MLERWLVHGSPAVGRALEIAQQRGGLFIAQAVGVNVEASARFPVKVEPVLLRQALHCVNLLLVHRRAPLR